MYEFFNSVFFSYACPLIYESEAYFCLLLCCCYHDTVLLLFLCHHVPHKVPRIWLTDMPLINWLDKLFMQDKKTKYALKSDVIHSAWCDWSKHSFLFWSVHFLRWANSIVYCMCTADTKSAACLAGGYRLTSLSSTRWAFYGFKNNAGVRSVLCISHYLDSDRCIPASETFAVTNSKMSRVSRSSLHSL